MLGKSQIRAVVEYAETTENAVWTFCYGGPCLDAIQSGDELTLSVLRGMTDKMEYARVENDPLGNILKMKVRNA